MDVILFLLRLSTQLALAATGAVVGLISFLLGRIGIGLARRAQPPASPQVPHSSPPPSPSQAQAAVAQNAPAVHVHVHLEQGAATRPSAAAADPAPVPAKIDTGFPSPAIVLNNPDHRIWIATSGDFMREHPAGDELLERLDHMLYVAAHRDGDPFTVAPPLDDMRPGTTDLASLTTASTLDEDDYFSTDRQDLPPPDGAIWLLAIGRKPRRLASGALS